jgi:hypothetical protein
VMTSVVLTNLEPRSIKIPLIGFYVGRDLLEVF